MCSIVLAQLIGILFYIFAPPLIALFNDNPDVIAFGTRQARIESLFYLFLALSHAISGVLRGSGKASVPMIIMFSVWCFLRVVFITFALHFIHAIEIIYIAYPFTWTVSSILFIIYIRRADWLHGLARR